MLLQWRHNGWDGVSIHQSYDSLLNRLFRHTVYPKKCAHGFCFAVRCCGYTLIDFPISIRLTSLALWQSNVCPSASKATLMNMDKYFMWIHYERLRNHNKAKHNKTVCIFLGIYCRSKKTSMLRVTGPCAGNSPVTGEFPAQRASNEENVSIWWHHHGCNVHKVLVIRPGTLL